MTKPQRCIAFHQPTGDRCRRNVGKRPFAQEFKLCPTHSKSVVLTLFAPNPEVRDRLARGSWTNIKELR